MRSLLDELVITEANRVPFETVLHIGEQHDQPVRMVIYGPSQSGKSALFQARGKEKDFLSTKEIMFCHASEIMSYINLDGIGDDFLNKVGSADVLLLDGLEKFFEEQNGPMVCRLLLEERNRNGRETVVATSRRFEELDKELLDRTFAGYERAYIEPLDDEGRVQFARQMQESYVKENDACPRMDEESLSYVAREFAEMPSDIRNVVRFICTAAGFDDGAVVTCEQVKSVLGPSKDK